MDVQKILDEAIDLAEAEAVAASHKAKLIDVFRQNHDAWTGRLFPAWKKAEKVCYPELVKLLHRCGFTTVTEPLVTRYMKLVRDERKRPSKGAKQAAIKVTGELEATVPAPASAPAVVAKPVPVVKRLEAVVPHAEAVAVSDWTAQRSRLESESSGAAWTGEDQFMWNHFLNVADLLNRDVIANFPDVENKLNGMQVKCYSELRKKYRATVKRLQAA